MAVFADPPVDDPIAVPADRSSAAAKKLGKLVIGFEYLRYLGTIIRRLDLVPTRACDPVNLAAQAASIATTTFAIGDVEPGVYRVSVVLRVTRAATTSSGILVTIGWTEGGVAKTQATTNLTGNLTTTREGVDMLLRVDDATSVTYATTYASVGATTMQYGLDIVVEKVGMDA